MARILLVTNSSLTNPKRGTPLHLCQIVRELRKEHTVFVCSATAPDEFKDIFVQYPQRGSRLQRFRSLVGIVKERRIEYTLTVNEASLLFPFLKLFTGVKTTLDLGGLGFEELYADGTYGILRYWYTRAKVWLLLHTYDIVFAVSKRMADHYGSMSKKWILIRGGVVPEEMLDATQVVRDPDTFVVGYMGNARAYQGLPNILEAAALLKKRGVPVRLNLVLSGPIEHIDSLIDSLGLRSVTTLHHDVSHAQAGILVGASDVLAIPRPSIPITEFAFPGKLAECLATGIPTVLTEVGPVHELRPELDACAIIIPPISIAGGLADAFERVYKMSSTERRALGARAHAYALRTLGWDRLGEVFRKGFTEGS